ncbi:hypothetical protein AVEN_211715-1 [Araneus ventricosus]|uniref:DUF4817 domain-containing protein n=1 Tax=Araneus ventricosus TaxID=182803 RepID=A0A4Y2M963_ARAVE|nr:hypothetical protein AVEN_211715-1 [Araneus ventricosus]
MFFYRLLSVLWFCYLVTEKNINSKFLYKLGKSAGQSRAMLKQVYGDNTVIFNPLTTKSSQNLTKSHKFIRIINEAREYMFSEQIEANIIEIPPGVDELTDEEDFDDEHATISSVSDIAGTDEKAVYYPRTRDQTDH